MIELNEVRQSQRDGLLHENNLCQQEKSKAPSREVDEEQNDLWNWIRYSSSLRESEQSRVPLTPAYDSPAVARNIRDPLLPATAASKAASATPSLTPTSFASPRPPLPAAKYQKPLFSSVGTSAPASAALGVSPLSTPQAPKNTANTQPPLNHVRPRFPLINAASTAALAGVLTAGAANVGAYCGVAKAVALTSALNPLGIFLLGACVAAIVCPNFLNWDKALAPPVDAAMRTGTNISSSLKTSAPKMYRFSASACGAFVAMGGWVSDHPRLCTVAALLGIWLYVDAASFLVVLNFMFRRSHDMVEKLNTKMIATLGIDAAAGAAS